MVIELDRERAVAQAEEARSFTAAMVVSSYGAVVAARVRELDTTSSLVVGISILSMFLIGLAAGWSGGGRRSLRMSRMVPWVFSTGSH